MLDVRYLVRERIPVQGVVLEVAASFVDEAFASIRVRISSAPSQCPYLCKRCASVPCATSSLWRINRCIDVRAIKSRNYS